ncbi:hypothetical protein DFA_08246 [Cavenderia fasciculata]|uniref:Uncharacterized protein n=1 Tax=Cavenderia fasciculata TaxID=261658 RepID=F4Q5J6_CACFS|nr:uncharacterized protein DFA_08246 [Cavenderia fasciculata]EGG17255.1 hypothetical protein DFA_08246 [Cavenderia fasciculata]|eukprot:XP_004355739.1 hypothetical protein DFA_08246 [Cavenderia fasciculata]
MKSQSMNIYSNTIIILKATIKMPMHVDLNEHVLKYYGVVKNQFGQESMVLVLTPCVTLGLALVSTPMSSLTKTFICVGIPILLVVTYINDNITVWNVGDIR